MDIEQAKKIEPGKIVPGGSPKQKDSFDALGRLTGKPDNPYAYSIKDPLFGEFFVLNTANAWWLDKAKVLNLIAALKIDASVIEACSYAGITKYQWSYFKEVHTNFSDEVEEICRQQLTLASRNNIAREIKVTEDDRKAGKQPNLELSRWYLERKKRKEFGNNIDVTSEGEKITKIEVEIVQPKKQEAKAPDNLPVEQKPNIEAKNNNEIKTKIDNNISKERGK